MSPRGLARVSLALVLGIAACARPPLPQEPFGPPSLPQASETILRVFEERWRDIEELRALGRVSYADRKSVV